MSVIFYATLGFGLGIGAPHLLMLGLSTLRAWGLV
jgi:hypothetical protein